MESVALGARVLLALVFAAAAVGKFADQPGARRALADFRVPQSALSMTAWLLPLAELATAAALIVQGAAREGAIAAAALLLLFIAGIAAAMVRGEAPDCHCFGQIGSSPAGARTLLRNAVLASIAIFVIIYGPGKDVGAWVSDRSAAVLAAIGLGFAAAALGVLSARLWQDNRTLRDDLQSAEASLALFPPGLPVGAPAPPFTLPSTGGEQVSLQSLLDRGKPIALVFVSPSCHPCMVMVPDLARWQRTLADRLTITLIAAGDAQQTSTVAAEHGLVDVLLQDRSEVFRAYRGAASPSVVIVTAEGRIGTRIRSSQGVVEAVIRYALQTGPPLERDGDGTRSGEPATPALEVRQWSGRGAERA